MRFLVGTHLIFSATAGRKSMPWFYFGLLVNDEPHHQGAMILENTNGARDRAKELAAELLIAKSELVGKRCSVRVISEANEEIYRTPLEPPPNWFAFSGRR
jgi:hypothetical protein